MPPSLSQEGSSAYEEEEPEQLHPIDDSPNSDTSVDYNGEPHLVRGDTTYPMEDHGTNDQQVSLSHELVEMTEGHTTAMPHSRTTTTNQMRRSARLLGKNGPLSTTEMAEHAARVRALECPPTPRARTQVEPILGSIKMSEATMGETDIAILATASGFVYSPGSAIYKKIGDRVAEGLGSETAHGLQ